MVFTYADRSWHSEGCEQQSRQSEFTLDASERQDVSERIASEGRMAGQGGGGKKSNKFRGRLADIMSICHLAAHRIKGLYEWSLLWEERAAKLLATVDFLQRSIN